MRIHATARIDPRAVFCGDISRLEIGAYSRIDAFCLISVGSAGICLGRHIHLSAGVKLFGGGGRIYLADGAFASSGATLYTVTDDMTADVLIGPQVQDRYRKLIRGDIVFGRAAGAATGAVILPGVTLGDAAVVGALSIAKRDVPAGHVVVGPNQRIGRVRNAEKILALLESQLRQTGEPC